jgi:hypothetical protein
MKVTAIIPDQLVQDVISRSGGKNITESLIIALNSYLSSQKINYLIDEIETAPLTFNEDFSAYNVRKINRSK